MPKPRPPFDPQRYAALKAQGLSQRAIAEQMGMPEATLRNHLKVLAPSLGEGVPMSDHGKPRQEAPQGDQSSPELPHEGPPKGDDGMPFASHAEGAPEDHPGMPPLYVHPGIPDESEESPVGAEGIEGVHEEIPALPLTGLQEGPHGPPGAGLTPELIEALTTSWPELQRMLAWWRARQQHSEEPPGKLARVTYHVAPKWIEAVKHEADVTGESYAAVVNRAFAQYFAGKSI